MAEVQRYRDHDEYVSWMNAWTGHMFTEALVTPVNALILVVFLALRHAPHPADDVLTFVVLLTIGNSLLVSLLERPFVVRARHPAPGGVGYAMGTFVVPPLVGALLGVMESPDWAIGGAIAASVPAWAVGLWFKPWRHYMGRVEFHEKTLLLAEHISARRLDRGWTPAARAAREKAQDAPTHPGPDGSASA